MVKELDVKFWGFMICFIIMYVFCIVNDKINCEILRFYIWFFYYDDRLFLKYLLLGFLGECLVYFGWI